MSGAEERRRGSSAIPGAISDGKRELMPEEVHMKTKRGRSGAIGKRGKSSTSGERRGNSSASGATSGNSSTPHSSSSRPFLEKYMEMVRPLPLPYKGEALLKWVDEHGRRTFHDSATDDSPPRPGDLGWVRKKETHDQRKLRKGCLVDWDQAIQVFSITIKESDVEKDEDGAFLVYGSIRARDVDYCRNYLFRRDSEKAMIAKVGDAIPLKGPRRAIACVHSSALEFNLNAIGAGASTGKPISKDFLVMTLWEGTELSIDCAANKGVQNALMDTVLTQTVRGKYGAAEVKYAVFSEAAAAILEIKPESGWERGLYGRIAARIVGFEEDGIPPNGSEAGSLSAQEIVLFDSERFGESITCDPEGHIQLWCNVIAVPRGRESRDCFLRLSVKLNAGVGGDAGEEEASFTPATKKGKDLKFGFAKLFAKVYWSSVGI